MTDPQEERQAPSNLREYLKEAKETLEVFRWVRNELDTKDSRKWFKRSLAALVTSTLVATLQPWFVSFIFDGLNQRRGEFVALGMISFLFITISEKLISFYYSQAREWILGLNWGQLDKKITKRFFEKSMGQHVQEGSTLNVANIDKGRWKVLDLQAMLLFEGVPALFSLAASYIFLWFLSPPAGLIITVVFVSYLVWMLYLNQRVANVCIPIDSDFRKLNRHRIERWENIERVKTSATQKEELESMTLRFDNIIERDRSFWLWYIGKCIQRDFAGIIGLVVIMAYGSWLVWSGAWSLGLLYPLFTWSSRVVENIWRIGNIEHNLNWNMPSVRSMIDAVSLEPDITPSTDSKTILHDESITVAFDKVGHTYPLGNGENQEQNKISIPVLADVSFMVKPGEKVALIGPSGAGKTTIMRLLLRFMDPDKGNIYVNGYDLRETDLNSWMRAIGYIPQHAQVLDGTLRYNLIYGMRPEERERITDKELWEFMRLLKLDFGKRLNKGLDTPVGRHGIKLSGGQAQRLMIGAAAIKKPRFMIIDEATSHLDSSTEKEVHDGLQEVLIKQVGALIIAHRLSTIKDLCDRFVVLRASEDVSPDQPQIEAVASSFKELYTLSPTFRRLADDQNLVL